MKCILKSNNTWEKGASCAPVTGNTAVNVLTLLPQNIKP